MPKRRIDQTLQEINQPEGEDQRGEMVTEQGSHAMLRALNGGDGLSEAAKLRGHNKQWPAGSPLVGQQGNCIDSAKTECGCPFETHSGRRFAQTDLEPRSRSAWEAPHPRND